MLLPAPFLVMVEQDHHLPSLVPLHPMLVVVVVEVMVVVLLELAAAVEVVQEVGQEMAQTERPILEVALAALTLAALVEPAVRAL
jgi:hypothetical protein